ncbi:lck-interacting transmembrane adapter 1 isoform X1 [Monodelphis domestica]|uniref:lck-interacting transmembrane adapter 1 isoform X1 n=2 Tax=Monodelphis domestica TaxID=13616 RepID=UPI0024E25BA7|nr:lck-interacting transmembrane adapter 1 isoform X1 [Monodelphis domestica]
MGWGADHALGRFKLGFSHSFTTVPYFLTWPLLHRPVSQSTTTPCMAVVQAAPQPQAPPALWGLSCLALGIMLCALCTTCHRNGKRRQQSVLKVVDESLLRQMQLHSLSKSDSKLHELNRGTRNSKAQRPTSIDLLYPRWPGGIKADVQMTTVPPVFIHRELPQPPLALDLLAIESTYSNVREAAVPSVPPMTQCGGEQPMISEKSVIAEYAYVRKIKKGAEVGPSLTSPSDSIPLERGAQQHEIATEVDVLYSKICKLGRKPLEATWNRAPCNQLDRNTQAPVVEAEDEESQRPATNSSYRTISPTCGKKTENGPTENFYESISEMEGLGKVALPGLLGRAQTHRPSEGF